MKKLETWACEVGKNNRDKNLQYKTKNRKKSKVESSHNRLLFCRLYNHMENAFHELYGCIILLLHDVRLNK